MSDMQKWLTANQAGEVLGVSGRTVIRMMEAGDLTGYRIGSAWKFKPGDVEAYIESRRFRVEEDKSEPAA
jgi:excisionase family DNA binding protein